jgi:hypothetical protein
MPAKAGTHALAAARQREAAYQAKQALLFLKKKKQKNFYFQRA